MAKEQWFAIRMREQIEPEDSIIAAVKVDVALAQRTQAAFHALRACGADAMRFVIPAGVYGLGFIPADTSPQSAAVKELVLDLEEEMPEAEFGDPDTDDTLAWCKKIGGNVGEWIAAGTTPRVGEVTLIVSSRGDAWLRCEDRMSPQWYASVESTSLAKALGIYDLAVASPLPARKDAGPPALGAESAEPAIPDGPVEAACPCCDSRELRACYTISATQGVTGWALRDGVACGVNYDGDERSYDVGPTTEFVCDGCDREWGAEQLTLYRDGRVVRPGDAGPAVTDHPHPRHGGLAP